MKSLFDYRDYKAYLVSLIRARPKGGRGIKLSLAEAIACPVSRISQVLNGDAHFTLEQAEGINQFFGHTSEEAQFFLLLVQLAKAGTPALRKRVDEQIAQVLKRRLDLKERFALKSGLSAEDQSRFYSSWIYGAVHVMLSIKKFQSKEAIARHLGLSPRRIGEILEFLASVGLAVRKEDGSFTIGQARIHLERDSPNIAKFHSNWRIQAIRSLDRDDVAEDLHYSAAVTLSDSDFMRIKSLLVQYIDEINAIIKDSKEEGAHCFSLDFFRL